MIRYQVVNLFPTWIGVRLTVFDPQKTDLALIYTWAAALGFWEIREWSLLTRALSRRQSRRANRPGLFRVWILEHYAEEAMNRRNVDPVYAAVWRKLQKACEKLNADAYLMQASKRRVKRFTPCAKAEVLIAAMADPNVKLLLAVELAVLEPCDCHPDLTINALLALCAPKEDADAVQSV
jgi:hypothetical protein